MELVRHQPQSEQVVERYDASGFKISGKRYDGPVVVLPEETSVWTAGRVDEITIGTLSAVTDAVPSIDLLIVGLGGSFGLLPPDVRQGLREKGIAAEAMATPAACRTYNILLTDQRRVAAALLPVGEEDISRTT